MPTVRAYEPRVETRNIPSAGLSGTSPAEMGANLGRGIESLGSDLGQIAAEERRKKNDADIQGADNELNRLTLGRMREAQDPAKGIRGATVAEDMRRLTEAWERGESEIAGKITDPEARRIYSQRSAQRRTSYEEGLANHADGVVFKYQEDQDTAAVALAGERAAMGYDSPVEVSSARMDVFNAISRRRDRNSWSPERTQAEAQQAASKIHAQVMGGFLSAGRTADAQAYFKTIPADEMTARDRTTAGEVVRNASDADKAQAVADQLHAEVVNGTLEPTQAEARLAEMSDSTAMRDQARQRFQVLQRSQQAAVREQVDGAEIKALQILSDTEGDITAVMKDPEVSATLNRWAPTSLKKLEAAAATWKDRPVSEPSAMMELEATDPAKIAAMSPAQFTAEYKGKFTRGDWDNAQRHWSQAQKASTDAQAKAQVTRAYEGARTDMQAVNDALEAAGIPANRSKDEDEDVATYRNELLTEADVELSAMRARLSRENKDTDNLDPAERYKAISNAFLRIGKFDQKKITGLLTPEERYDRIPLTDRQKILDAWRTRYNEASPSQRRNMVPTPTAEQIMDTYFKRQRGQGGG